jgi:hypothetical protein
MRFTFALLTVLSCAAACGPNSAQIQRAREARYHAEPGQLLQGAAAAAEAEHYKIGEVDAEHGAFMTLDKFFTAEGTTESVGADGGIRAADRSIVLAYVVRLAEADGGGYTIEIQPDVRRYFVDRPNVDPVPAGDPTMPGWVATRTDALAVAIHDQLAAYEAK